MDSLVVKGSLGHMSLNCPFSVVRGKIKIKNWGMVNWKMSVRQWIHSQLVKLELAELLAIDKLFTGQQQLMAAIDDLKAAVQEESVDLGLLATAVQNEEAAVKAAIDAMQMSTDVGVVNATTILKTHHANLQTILAGLTSFTASLPVAPVEPTV